MGISLLIWSQLASDSVTRSLNRCFLLLWDILCAILWTACRKKSVKSSSIRNQAWVNHEGVKWMVSSLMMLVGFFDVGRSNGVKVCVVGHCVSVVTTGKWKRGWWGEDERSGRWKNLEWMIALHCFFVHRFPLWWTFTSLYSDCWLNATSRWDLHEEKHVFSSVRYLEQRVTVALSPHCFEVTDIQTWADSETNRALSLIHITS